MNLALVVFLSDPSTLSMDFVGFGNLSGKASLTFLAANFPPRFINNPTSPTKVPPNKTPDKRFKYIQVFKNHGIKAGSSIHHPHSQIIALPVIVGVAVGILLDRQFNTIILFDFFNKEKTSF